MCGMLIMQIALLESVAHLFFKIFNFSSCMWFKSKPVEYFHVASRYVGLCRWYLYLNLVLTELYKQWMIYSWFRSNPKYSLFKVCCVEKSSVCLHYSRITLKYNVKLIISYMFFQNCFWEKLLCSGSGNNWIWRICLHSTREIGNYRFLRCSQRWTTG